MVKLPNGTTCQRHQDQLKSCPEQVTTSTQYLPDTVPPVLLTVPSAVSPTTTSVQTSTSTVPHCYPQRIRYLPFRYPNH